MAKFFNLNSQRASREHVEGLPARRLTDTNLRTAPKKTVESIYKLQKNTYFQDLMSIEGLGSKKKADEKNLKSAKTISRPLDLLVFTRKNAVVLDTGGGIPMSPKQTTSSKQMSGSPAYSRPSHKKISINSSKGESSTKENLKLKVMELEKKLKTYEKASKTVRADGSDETLKKKRSSKNIPVHFVSPPVLTMYSTRNDKPGMYLDLENSYTEIRSKYDFPGSATSVSRVVIDHDQSLNCRNGHQTSIEAEIAKLRDRMKAVLHRDLRVIKTLNQAGL